MKFYVAGLEQLLTQIAAGKIKALLLYGPDKGYINSICTAITKKFDLLSSSVNYAGLKAPQLEMKLNSQNFFAKKELIKIQGVAGAFDVNIKAVLATSFFNFVVFIGDEFSPSSAIRKFFESENYLASIGCYHDDAAGVLKIVLKKCNDNGFTIDQAALTYLKAHLTGDHLLIHNELDKLLGFAHDKKNITLEDVTAVISSELTGSGDEMCLYFAQTKAKEFLQEISKLLLQPSINEVLIIRALIRFYMNLYIVRSKIEAGENIDNAIKTLSPPIFFKYLNDFKRVAHNFTALEAIKNLAILQQAEVDFKLAPQSFDFFNQIYLKCHG